jgi:arylsulfatase A-like enzyme
MTGLRPDSIKVWDLVTDFRAAAPDAVTIPQHFRANGYRAQAFGKIYHNTMPDDVSWDVPTHQPKGIEGRSAENRERLAEFKRQMKTDGKRPQAIERMRGPATEMQDVPDDRTLDGRLTVDAIATMREMAADEKPFFLAVGYIRPHLPLVSPKKYWDMYDRAAIPLAASDPAARPPLPSASVPWAASTNCAGTWTTPMRPRPSRGPSPRSGSAS